MKIIKGFPTPIKNHYKVYVRTITYNQSIYIEDCLNGVAMQETDFPFAHHVVDDASTDGEQDVIKSWINRECDVENAEYYDNDICTITIAKHKKNKNYTLAAYFLKLNLHKDPRKEFLFSHWREVCPYEALCEGDDYWNDPKKLKKQVDWLDEHEDYSMCCSDAHIATPQGEISWRRYDEDTTIPTEEVIKGGGPFIMTCSIIHRTNILSDYPDYCKYCVIGDYPLQMWCAIKGKVRYFEKKSVTYRYMAEGSWNVAYMNTPIEQLLQSWDSQIKMLQGLNSYTKGKYNDLFNKICNDFIHGKILIHTKDRHAIAKHYPAYVDTFKAAYFFENIFLSLGLNRFAKSVFFMHHGKFKMAVTELPLVAQLYSFLKH